MHIVALIPARGGSKGVPRKNLRLLGGFPLIAYSIAAARMSGRITRILISTDSEEIAETSRKFGAEVPFLRPAELAKDTSPDIDFVLHALGWFGDTRQPLPDLLIHLRPTTPLRDPAVMEAAIDQFLAGSADSLRSGHPAPESPFKWFLRNKEGYFTPLRTDASNDTANLPRQMFPTCYIPDGYVDVLKPSFILEKRELHGKRMLGFISPFCHEVDTPDDFEQLEYELARKGSPVWEYLKHHFG